MSCAVEFTRDLSGSVRGNAAVVDDTKQHSAAEMERMMKIQNVLLKAMTKKITWWAAAEIIGVTLMVLDIYHARGKGCLSLRIRERRSTLVRMVHRPIQSLGHRTPGMASCAAFAARCSANDERP